MIKTLISKLKQLNQPIIWIIVFFQFLHILDEFKKDWSGTDKSLFLFWSEKISPDQLNLMLTLSKYGIGFISIISLILLFRFIFYLAPKRKYILFTLYLFIFFIYFFLLSYLYSLELPFDFSILFLNFNTINDKDFLLAALPYVRTGPLILFIVCASLLYYWGIKKNSFVTAQKTNWSKALTVLAIYIGFIIIPFKSYDPVLELFKSAYSYYKIKYSSSLNSGDFQLVKQSFNLSNVPFNKNGEKQPNIMIIMVESFNSYFVENKNENGEFFTPEFNKLIKEGLYVEEFYGNSVQSCKGQFATLSSLIPPIYGFAFRHYAHTQYNLISHILKDRGYYNIFFQASGNLLADNTKSFLQQNGFDDVKSAEQFATENDAGFRFGWGLQDTRLYHHFFNYYDSTIKEKNKPFFAVLPTIYSHNNTVQIPEKDRYLYPKASKSFEYFANVIKLTDNHLKDLFSELKKRNLLENTIVIITGDHSRSAISGSKVSFNQSGFSNDIFKVPFLMVWKNHIPAKRIKDTAFSQIDIAPTLIDALQLPIKEHHFQGQSLFSGNKDNNVYLVQPYNGIYLSVINHPYKFAKHIESGNTYLYNLDDDPFEENNIINSNIAIKDQLETKIQSIFSTNSLIKKNKVWTKKIDK